MVKFISCDDDDDYDMAAAGFDDDGNDDDDNAEKSIHNGCDHILTFPAVFPRSVSVKKGMENSDTVLESTKLKSSSNSREEILKLTVSASVRMRLSQIKFGAFFCLKVTRLFIIGFRYKLRIKDC